MENLCPQIFIATLFIVAKNWKHHKCPLNEWKTKCSIFIYTTEYNSKLKRNEVLIYITMWMNLSKRIQIQKPSYSVTYLFKISRIGKTLERTKQTDNCQKRQRGKLGVAANRYGLGRGDSGNVLEFDSGYDCTTL